MTAGASSVNNILSVELGWLVGWSLTAFSAQKGYIAPERGVRLQH